LTEVGSFLEISVSNAIYILTIIVILIIVIVVADMITKVKTAGTNVRLAEMTLNRDKLNLMSKRVLFDDLKNAAITLKDEEREKIESIQQDNAILSRRSIALMNEIEERMKRLELGTDMARMFKIMRDLEKKESKLYGKTQDGVRNEK
jgi:hypothetical protein